jgi:hypothetical protein
MPTNNVDDLMAKAFSIEREPRSLEYKTGMQAYFRLKINKTPYLCPYESGTSQADAYAAGVNEARHTWNGINRHNSDATS